MLLFENSCALFVLWIVLGVWSFVLFSCVFSGAFFLKTAVLFLCFGLCWEFGVLCCSVVLPFGHPLGKHEQQHEKSATENSYWPGNLETRPRFVKLKPFRPAGPPWSPTASSPGLAGATARCLQLPALQRNEKFHNRRGAMAPKGNPQRIGYRIAV